MRAALRQTLHEPAPGGGQWMGRWPGALHHAWRVALMARVRGQPARPKAIPCWSAQRRKNAPIERTGRIEWRARPGVADDVDNGMP